MKIEASHADDRQRFREYYKSLADNDVARLSMDENLVPADRDAISDEIDARGLDLSAYKSRFSEEIAAAKAAGVLGAIPSSALTVTESDRSHQLMGGVGLLVFALVGIHKWVLGDATTWRKEGSLATWLALGVMLTWDPPVRVFKGQASGKFVVWLILAWLYLAAIAAPLAVPALGKVVAGFNPLVVAAAIGAPGIVVGLLRLSKRLSSHDGGAPTSP